MAKEVGGSFVYVETTVRWPGAVLRVYFVACCALPAAMQARYG